MNRSRLVCSAVLLVMLPACSSAPPPVVTPPRLVRTFDENMAWILRLEQDRVLRLPAPEAPPQPVVPPSRGRAPVVVAQPPSPDLIALLEDEVPRIRRRAALAIGRVRLEEGIAPLAALLGRETDPEVRQMAAFALGLI